ncbi:MAG TPA: hypothetical protein VGM29_05350 [Polyangiaceae bacterium]
MPASAADVARFEALAARAADRDEAARKELIERLWPDWISIVSSSRSMGKMARSEDHVHEVVTLAIEKLCKGDARALKLFVAWRERNADKTFFDWIRIVTKNVIRDYVREQLGSSRTPGDELSVKRLLNEFASSPALDEQSFRPPLTATQTARQLLEFAEQRLPADQLHALRSWLAGSSFEDISGELEQGTEDARKLLRAAVATLRREFGDGQH